MGTEAACGVVFGVERLGRSSGRPLDHSRLRAGLRPNVVPSRWMNTDSSWRMNDWGRTFNDGCCIDIPRHE
jgi:hypothetical protein